MAPPEEDSTLTQRKVTTGKNSTAKAVEHGKRLVSDLQKQIGESPKAKAAKEKVIGVANRAKSGDMRYE